MDPTNFKLEHFIKPLLEKMANELKRYADGVSTEELSEIEEYILNHDKFLRKAMYEIEDMKRGQTRNRVVFDLNPDKMKVFLNLALSTQHINANDVNEIVSFLDKNIYGWQGSSYILNNHCLRDPAYGTRNCCRMLDNITDIESAKEHFKNLHDIFFDNEYGKYITYIFSYCLAALFSSKLSEARLRVPFFLQIACEKDSAWHLLIKDIISICDINSGVFEECNHKDKYCGYIRSKTLCPTKSVTNDIEALVFNRDIPIIVEGIADGYENERHYNNLLREVVNIPNKRKSLDVRGKFNVLPIFLCREIKSSFNNVFNIDLTDLEISQEYLTSFRESKQLIASLVLGIILEFPNCLLQRMIEPDNRKVNPYSSVIGNYITTVHTKHTHITPQSTENVGLLNFFFREFMNVFLNTFSFSRSEKFKIPHVSGIQIPQNGKEIINRLSERSEGSLVELHKLHMPTSMSIDIVKNITKDKAMILRKNAVKLAKNIEKHYRDLKVYIGVTHVDVKEDRCIFRVDTLQKTKVTDVSENSNVQTVQGRLKEYEYFRINLTDPMAIKIIVAKEALKDNSLMDILESPSFASSKKKIPYAIGYDDTGIMCIEDLWDFPHLLLGGATKTGKSTAMMCLLMSIAYKHRTGDVNVLILDLLGRELSDFEVFNNRPFLSSPVITDAHKGMNVILKLEETMNSRQKDKNLTDMPYIVCIIDEFPKLFSDKRNKPCADNLEDALTKLLAQGRHSKIHMVLAAQNPTKKHMVCDLANLDAKIAFRCSNHHQSNAILGRTDAKRLIGKGQMIFDYYADIGRRLQGAYISEADMKQQLGELAKAFEQKNKYPYVIDETESSQPLTEFNEGKSDTPQKPSAEDKFNDNLLKVIELLLEQGRIANSAVIKELNVTFHTADKYMVELENCGLIPPLNGGRGARKINPIEKVNISELRAFLERRGYSEDVMANAINKITEHSSAVISDDVGTQASASQGSVFKKESSISQPPLESVNPSAPEAATETTSTLISKQESHDTDPEADTPQALPNETTGTQYVPVYRKNRKNKKRR